jgi:DNA repair protein RadC
MINSTTNSGHSYTIQQLPENERPRERLLLHGAESLATAELIAIILGSGMQGRSVLELAQDIVVRFGSIQGLASASVQELCLIRGLGQAKALQLKAAFGLGLRLSQNAASLKYRIENPVHAYNLIKEDLEHEKRELFMVILQDVKGYVINRQVVAMGTLSSIAVHPRDVFNPAIRHNAASVILVHNHPSGDPTPSQEDHTLTQALIDAGRIMNIYIHDHLIIGDQSYVSLRQRGISFD